MYITVREASQLTGLSERTIRRRIAAGTIRARKGESNRVELNCDELPSGRHATMWSLLLDCLRDLAQRVERLERQVDGSGERDVTLRARPARTAAPSPAKVIH